MSNYSVDIFWSDEDECFIAISGVFPGVSAHGDSRLEALKELEIAVSGAEEILREEAKGRGMK